MFFLHVCLGPTETRRGHWNLLHNHTEVKQNQFIKGLQIERDELTRHRERLTSLLIPRYLSAVLGLPLSPHTKREPEQDSPHAFFCSLSVGM